MKKIGFLLLSIVMAVSMVGCSNEGTSTNGTGNESVTNSIDVEEARKMALEHANVKLEDVKFIREEKEMEDGKEYIEIEFYSNGREYDYEIDVATGKIARYDNNVEDFTIPTQQDGMVAETPKLTPVEARQIALKHAELQEVNVEFIKEEQEVENGRMAYEVEFRANNIAYDYTIDSNTGEIIEFSHEK